MGLIVFNLKIKRKKKANADKELQKMQTITMDIADSILYSINYGKTHPIYIQFIRKINVLKQI